MGRVEAPAVLLEGIARSSTPAGLDTEGSLKGVQVEGDQFTRMEGTMTPGDSL